MKNLIIVSVFFISLCSSCEDENGIIDNPCMQGFDKSLESTLEIEDTISTFCATCVWGCDEVYSSDFPYDYFYPCFNPSNPEQFAYYRYDNVILGLGFEIWVIDFCTGSKKMLVDNAFYGLDWSVKGWLIYTANDQNIWKIKPNGDSLTQVTFTGEYNRYPKWSPDGTQIAFNSEIQSNTFFFVSDESGNIQDTIEELSRTRTWSWIDNERIFYLDRESGISPPLLNFNYYNINSKTVTLLHNLQLTNYTNDSLVSSSIVVPSENSLIWGAPGVIGKTNLVNGTYEIIKKKLRQEWYEEQVAIRPGKNEIVFTKRTLHEVDNCHVDSEYDFYVIDKNGINLKKIKLP